jgi:hypothetical protein
MAGPSGAPMSPNYARPLPLDNLSPTSTPKSRSSPQGLEVEVEEEEVVEQATRQASARGGGGLRVGRVGSRCCSLKKGGLFATALDNLVAKCSLVGIIIYVL